MTAKELIELLSKVNPDSKVIVYTSEIDEFTSRYINISQKDIYTEDDDTVIIDIT